MAKEWVPLPEPIDRSLWQRMARRTKGGIRRVFAGTGMAYRIMGEQIYIAAEPIEPLYARALQAADQRLRSDARQRIEADVPGIDLSDGVDAFIEDQQVDPDQLGRQQRLQLGVLASRDPLEIAAVVARRPDLRLYRVGLRRAGLYRLAFWKIVGALATGTNPDTLSFVELNELPTDSAPALYPSLLCTPPLMVRAQPTALVLTTHIGAQLVAIAASGDGFARDPYLPAWPVGFAPSNLGGDGKGAYAGGQHHTAGYSAEVLEDLIQAGNRTLSHVTDPARWVAPDGTLDLTERMITWTSIQMGLEALNSVGSDFGAPSSLWEAFRSLGTLHGIWEGGRFGSVPFAWMFDPAAIRSLALTNIAHPEHRAWAAQIVANYETALHRTFGNDPVVAEGPTAPCTGAKGMADTRNLMHGVGAPINNRVRRLRALEVMERERANLHLVREISGIWWYAALSAPSRLLHAGVNPASPPPAAAGDP